MNDTVDILLSVYNGEEFLQELLDSLILQTCNSWRLIINNDASTDNSLNIIKTFKEQNSNKVFLLDNNSNINSGPALSYAKLLSASNSKYIMFCDQDDVWLPEKIEKMLNTMKKLEKKHSSNSNLLVYSDMKICSENLKIISDSFYKHNKGLSTQTTLKNILFNNNIAGCCMLINKNLKDFSLPMDDNIIMHDWWINLCVNISGHSQFIPEQLLLYRQHENNYYGAPNNKNMFLKYFKISQYKKNLKKMINQLKKLNERYKKYMQDEDITIISQLAHMSDKNFFMRKYLIYKYSKYSVTSLLKKFFMLIFI